MAPDHSTETTAFGFIVRTSNNHHLPKKEKTSMAKKDTLNAIVKLLDTFLAENDIHLTNKEHRKRVVSSLNRAVVCGFNQNIPNIQVNRDNLIPLPIRAHIFSPIFNSDVNILNEKE